MTNITARECFDALRAHSRVDALRGLTGAWEVDLADAGKWCVRIDDGRLYVTEGGTPDPNARFLGREADFVRVALGEDNENILTALMRGRLRVEGDLRFAQRLDILLPLEDRERLGMEGTPS